MQREAEKEMEFCWRQRTAGTQASVPRYGLTRGGKIASHGDLNASLELSWLEWARLAVIRRIMVAVVIECLTEPRTLIEIEKAHRMRRGQAFEYYVLGLDLWCEIRGWIRGPSMEGGPHLGPEGVRR
jgi:hypothetical protein